MMLAIYGDTEIFIFNDNTVSTFPPILFSQPKESICENLNLRHMKTFFCLSIILPRVNFKSHLINVLNITQTE